METEKTVSMESRAARPPAVKLLHFGWCHDLDVGGRRSLAQVSECLLPFIMAVSFTETL